MGKRRVKKSANARYFDYSLLFVIIFVVGLGVVMIYSTSSYTAQMDYGYSEYYFYKQLLFSSIGFLIMYITYRMDYHIWRKLSKLAFAVPALLTMALPFIGSSANGATRWIRFGPIGVQPADVAKAGVIVALSALVCYAGQNIKKLRYAVIAWAATSGVLAALVMIISRNMSSAIIICGIGFVMIFVAYPGYKPFVLFTGAAGVGVAGVFIWITNAVKTGVSLGSFRLNRIMVWLNPENYASGVGYQTVQALYAIGSGGLFGKGLGKSLQILGFIPESQNDMIFSIVCEELGLFGAVCIILVFALMLWRIVHIAQNAPDLFGTLLATGVFAHVAIQVILNIAVVTNLIPNTGVSLPFISYGGSSTVVLLAEMGIVLNVSSQIRLER